MQKMKSRKGFTLIEMLIVVGIIAILVAVSIPMVNSSLEKAKIATDAANERAAKAAIMVAYLTDDGNTFDPNTNKNYDAEKGIMTSGTPKGYGRCKDHKDAFIQVNDFKSETGTFSVVWTDGTSEKGTPHGTNTAVSTATPEPG